MSRNTVKFYLLGQSKCTVERQGCWHWHASGRLCPSGHHWGEASCPKVRRPFGCRPHWWNLVRFRAHNRKHRGLSSLVLLKMSGQCSYKRPCQSPTFPCTHPTLSVALPSCRPVAAGSGWGGGSEVPHAVRSNCFMAIPGWP